MREHNLYFSNPKFPKGFVASIRPGNKWFDQIQMGDMLNLLEVDGLYNYGIATIEGIMHIPFHMINDDLLEMEAHTKYHDRQELMRILKGHDPKFNKYSRVTIIIFKVF